MKLDIRRAGIGSAYQPSRRVSNELDATGPERSSTYCRAGGKRAMQLCHAVIGVVTGAFGNDKQVQVILHVFTDAR